MSAGCCNQNCEQGDTCPLHRPMDEHQLTIIKIRSAAYVALLVLGFVAATAVRPCDEPDDHAAQVKAQRMERADTMLGIERK